MLEESLREIGLTTGECRVYLVLLELGSSTTGPIIKKSRISGSKVYEVLDRLISKGLVSSITQNGVKYFEAADPARILDYLSEKETKVGMQKVSIQKIIPELMLRRTTSEKGTVNVFLGFEGLKTANEDIIKTLHKGEEWLNMGLTRQPESWEAYFTRRQHVRAEKGIIHKHLINAKYKSLYQQRKNLPHTEFRFLPAELEMPTSTEIYGDKVIIMILLQESPMAIMMDNKAVAASFRKYFYVLWKNAKKR